MPRLQHLHRSPVLWIAGAALLLLAGCSATKLHTARELARDSEPLQHFVLNPQARLLIVGDSTAVGTGASSAQSSLAGLLASRWPNLLIENRARDGATFEDVRRQLDESTAAAKRYDVVLVNAGGNDVIRFRDLDKVRGHIAATAQRARELADTVILMPGGNVGNAPFFFPPVSWVMTSRSRRLHDAVRTVAADQGATYVNLFRERADDPFARQPDLNAKDGLHPSDAGYRLWYDELLKQSTLAQRVTRAPAAATPPVASKAVPTS